MRDIIIILTIFVLIGCEVNEPKTVSQNDRIELLPEPDKDLREKYKQQQKNLAKKSNFIIPDGYKLFEEIHGDLNGDGLDDFVQIIKGTEKKKVVINRFDKEVDRNRRGILIYLTNKDTTFLTTKNLNCFMSENEDGGVYYPPELSIDIKDGKLYVHYNHGRYGYWKYTFRYQHDDFELIGYDSSENYGPIINREISVNFLTKKKLTRENVNENTEAGGDEIFEDTWEDIKVNELFRLSEITEFEKLEYTDKIESSNK